MTGDALGGTLAVVVNGVLTLSISRIMQRRAQRMLYVQLSPRDSTRTVHCHYTPEEKSGANIAHGGLMMGDWQEITLLLAHFRTHSLLL